jgi:Di-haem oxidoreductase, putative peroxidase
MKPWFAILVLLVSVSVDAQRRRPSASPAPPQQQPSATFGSPLPGLSTELFLEWSHGRREFLDTKSVADGLGPVFNFQSCGGCHLVPVAGGSGPQTNTRIGSVVDGVYYDLTEHGGSLLQVRGIGTPEGGTHRFDGEKVPKEATVVSRRRTTTLLGLGLVDATDDSTFIALAAAQAARGDGTAGRVSLVRNILNGMKTVGKFGWKAQVPTLQQFAGDAYLNEMGITTPLFPDENCPAGNCANLKFNPRPGLNDDGGNVDATTTFMRFLGPPPRAGGSPRTSAPARRSSRASAATRVTWLRCRPARTRTRRSTASPITPTPTSCCTTWAPSATASHRTARTRARCARRRCGARDCRSSSSTTTAPTASMRRSSRTTGRDSAPRTGSRR